MRREEIAFANGSVRLSATIMLPDEARRSSGLVLIGGSGAMDRHNGGFFDLLSEHMVDAGIAVLAYDKRGAGDSTGHWATATIDDLAGDAGAAFAALEAHERIASEAVGVLGHSEGGWVAARLCSQKRPGPRVILNSCPAVSFMDAEQFALSAAGASPQDAAATRLLLQELTRAAQSGCELSQGQRILADARDEPWYATVEASGLVLDDASWSVLRAWGSYDPLDDLRALTSPTLVVLGSEDPLVPVEASLARYEATAREAGRPQESVVFADADHRFHSATTGDLAAGYLPKLSDWVLQQPV